MSFDEIQAVFPGDPVSADNTQQKIQGLVNSGRLKGGQVSRVYAVHDDACPYLISKGSLRCNCDVEIWDSVTRKRIG